MKNILLLHKNIFLLIIGTLLLLGGLAGGYLFLNGYFDNTEAAPTPTIEEIAPTPLAEDTFTADLVKTPIDSTPTLEPKKSLSPLNMEAYFVHADLSSGLETPMIPDRIVIPSVGIDATVIVAEYNSTNVDGETFGQWMAPNELAAGWQPDSALLGQVGNTVINGHHNEYGEVFGKLVDVKIGDKVYVYSHGTKFSFTVSNRMILQERFVSLATRLQNAQWLAESNDVRLTLVTCWPKISNTHRLILVARPDSPGE